MAVSVSITGDAILGFLILVDDSDDDGDLIKVTRHDQSGHYGPVTVRGVDMVATASSIDVTDYEAPINTALRYTVDVYLDTDTDTVVSTVTSPTVQTYAPTGYAIISHVLNPALRVAGGIIDLSTWSYSSTVLGSHRVLGRRNPVVVTDVQGGRTGTIVASNINVFDIAFDGSSPYDRYEVTDGSWGDIFTDGGTLLFRSDWELSGFDDLYFCVTGDVSVTRLTRVLGTEPVPVKQFTIPYTEIDRPLTSTASLTLDTWQSVLNSNATWQQVLDSHDTWLSVLSNPDS